MKPPIYFKDGAPEVLPLPPPRVVTKIWYERDRFERYTGRTFAIMWNGDMRHVGVSVCNESDQFNRKRGRQIAIGRARAEFDGRKKVEGTFYYRFSFDSRSPNDGIAANVPEYLYRPKEAQ